MENATKRSLRATILLSVLFGPLVLAGFAIYGTGIIWRTMFPRKSPRNERKGSV